MCYILNYVYIIHSKLNSVTNNYVTLKATPFNSVINESD